MLSTIQEEVIARLDSKLSGILIKAVEIFCNDSNCLDQNKAVISVSLPAVSLDQAEQASRAYFVQPGTLTLILDGLFEDLSGEFGAYSVSEQCQTILSGYRPNSVDNYSTGLLGFQMIRSELNDIFQEQKLLKWQQVFMIQLMFEGSPQ